MLKQKEKVSTVARKIPKAPDEKAFDPESLDSSESVTWRIFRIMSEFVSGFQFIARYPNAISFFGSARLKEGSRYYLDAYELAKKLGKKGFNIITGGGPGIMEAANRGAYESKAASMGLNIQLPFEQRTNSYVTRGIGFHYFFTRKVMLSAAGQAYVFFPGGFGTLDEFFEIITLVQTRKMNPIPIVLYGKEFWSPLIKFIDDVVRKKFAAVDANNCDLYTLVDSVSEAFAVLKKSKPRQDF